MRLRSQRVGTIHFRFTSMRVTSTGRSRFNRGNHALGEVVMAWPRIGEEDHFERRHWLTGALAE